MFLPCPFCGEENDIVCTQIPELFNNNYLVRCEFCGAIGEQCSKINVAIECWNTRK